MKKIVKWTLIVFALLFVAVQFVRPAKTNPKSDETSALHSQIVVPADVEGVLQRACYDCHSNGTRWPWYSQVAPVSWFLIDHVNEGRHELNFSEWGSYNNQRKVKKLHEIEEQVQRGEMPISSYTILHTDARLSGEEKNLLINWAKAEAEKISNQGTTANVSLDDH